MRNKGHKPGIHEKYLMKRQVKLDRASPDALKEIVLALENRPAVAAVSLNEKKLRIDIAYDASVESLDHILAVMEEHGGDIAHDWWSNLKAGWYRSTDENIKDNATHEPWSCHQAPHKPKKPRNFR